MINQGNFKFTSFQKSHTLFEGNANNTNNKNNNTNTSNKNNSIIGYNNNNENSYNNINDCYNTANAAFSNVNNRYLTNYGESTDNKFSVPLPNMNQQLPFMPPPNLYNNFYPPYYN